MPNNLFLNRMLIHTDEGMVAYDEKFHRGINIIRGNNSSGKSTITHFIFYVLGGDFTDFVPEAKLCSNVYAEVEMNGATFTMRRELEKDDEGKVKSKAPMYIYWGKMEESLSPPPDNKWQKFGYNTTAHRKSFSNVIFENLDLPLVKGDSNITIHQVLRLLYIDQESPTGSLFFYENFDSQLTRETVSELLLGIYNEELYQVKKDLIVAEKEYVEVKNEIKVTQQFFSDPLTLNPIHVKGMIRSREKDIKEIEDEIIAIREEGKTVRYGQKTKLEFQKLNKEAIKQREKVLRLEDGIQLLENEIEDSEFFIDTLNTKIHALENSISTRDFLGNLPLEYCPECLTKIRPNNDLERCKLCKEKVDVSFGVVKARRMKQEISFQIAESNKILSTNKKSLNVLESKYEAELSKLHQLQRQVNSSLSDVRTIKQERLDKLISDKGFIEGEILQFKTLLENAELYKKLQERKTNLENQINTFKSFIRKTELQQEKLKEKINERIREEGVYLLNNDLERQDEFKNADEFHIDYSNNIAFLSNKFSRYSASSNFYLKVSARFAIFLASLSVERMRFPRFIFADNMEDKGIEEKRAQNLQKILIERLTNFDQNNYQVIYTTSYITEELNDSPFVVGGFYTKKNPSLKNINRANIV